MANFFEKLKRGMGIEDYNQPTTRPTEEEVLGVKRKKLKKPKKLEIKVKPIKLKIEKEKPGVKEEEEIKVKKEKWFEPEGQLAVDVYQTKNDLVIQSAIAGIKPENLDLTLERDIVTIRGIRERPLQEEGDYFYQECYWGPFSREIILPVEVDPSQAAASMKEGILTIRIPKIKRERKRKIVIKA